MNSTLGADAAKLAGLQMDMLAKLRDGTMDIGHLEMFCNLTPDARTERFSDKKKQKQPKTVPAEPVEESTEKFALLADLGVITVPDDYDHATWLDKFKAEHETKFRYGYNSNITSANFPKPSRILKPGDKLRVKAWKQIVPGRTTSEERMAFLDGQKSVYTGAHGAGLVFLEKRKQLPKGYWYASFDKKENLWEDAAGFHRVPFVDAFSDDEFYFGLGDFALVWGDGDSAFFSFCDEVQPSAA